jgi:hypothetical protein
MSDYQITAEYFRRCTIYPSPRVGDVVIIRGKGILQIVSYNPDNRVYGASSIQLRRPRPDDND